MKTSMAIPIRFWTLVLAGLLIYQFSSSAAADWCKFEKDIELTLDVSGSEELAVTAVAGDLEIIGVSGSDEAVIRGKVCASKEAWLEEASVETKSGKHAQINVNLSDTNGGGWSLFGKNTYLWLDLSIEVPESLVLEVKDSSGDLSIIGVAGVQLQDSSGDIEIENVTGDVTVRDSSGDIEIESIKGNFTVDADSSGDIYVEDIDGTVLVRRDSSGEIRVSHVSHDVIVERDSSGDISASDVGGDFRVLKDGSGSISSHDIQGEIQLPRSD